MLTPAPPIPQRGDRTTFASRVDAFLTWEGNTLVPELNALQANLNTIAAGGAYALPYAFSYSLAPVGTSAGGKVGWPSTNRGAFYVDTKNAAGVLVSTTLASVTAANASAVKGHLRVQKTNDPSAWILFSITGYSADASGRYGVFSVSLLDSSKPADNSPFSEGDSVMLFLQRTGDKGDKGDNGAAVVPTLYVRDERPQGIDGGSLTGSFTVRQLNSVKTNSIAGASLANNQVTVPAGAYNIFARAPAAGCAGHRIALWDVTNSGFVEIGSSEYADVGVKYSTNKSILEVRNFTISARTFELRHYAIAGNNNATGGTPTNLVGPEIYAELIFEKVA